MEQMTAQEALEAAKGITFEKAWSILQDDHRKWMEKFEAEWKKREAEEKKREAEERKREAKRAAEEKKREAERKAEEKKREAERKAEMAEFKKNLEKAVGDLGNSLGGLTEALFSGSLHKRFAKYGYVFTAQNPDRIFYDENGQGICEADIWLENGEAYMAIEVKTKPKKSDIDGHIKRLEKIRNHMNRTGKTQKLLGAIAGGVFKPEVMQYTHEKGLYVIVQSGESIEIATPEDFEPHEW